MAPIRKIIATNCKDACLKSIKRLKEKEEDYTKTYIQLKTDEKEIAIRLANLRKIHKINQADQLQKSELVKFIFD